MKTHSQMNESPESWKLIEQSNVKCKKIIIQNEKDNEHQISWNDWKNIKRKDKNPSRSAKSLDISYY